MLHLQLPYNSIYTECNTCSYLTTVYTQNVTPAGTLQQYHTTRTQNVTPAGATLHKYKHKDKGGQISNEKIATFISNEPLGNTPSVFEICVGGVRKTADGVMN